MKEKILEVIKYLPKFEEKDEGNVIVYDDVGYSFLAYERETFKALLSYEIQNYFDNNMIEFNLIPSEFRYEVKVEFFGYISFENPTTNRLAGMIEALLEIEEMKSNIMQEMKG